MKQRGLTLFELMIAVIFVIIIVAFVMTGIDSSNNYSYGINGITETRCINGMQFVVGQSGSVQQILGPNGGGVPCQ